MPIGERIQAARLAKRWSLRELATRAGVSHTAIAKYEQDRAAPGAGVLQRLSRALERPLDFFAGESRKAVSFTLYRKPDALRPRDEGSIRAGLWEWLERYLEIEDILGFPPGLTLPKYYAATFEAVENSAGRLREYWNLGSDPLRNLAGLLEEQGIKVGWQAGIADLDACVYQVNGAPLIVVSADASVVEQRLYLARELGYLVLQMGGAIYLEAAAQRFARAFLAPSSSARMALGSRRSAIGLQELSWLSREYGLSAQGWVERARDLEIIDEAVSIKLLRLLRRGGKKEPQAKESGEISHRLERLVCRALAEGLITQNKAVKILPMLSESGVPNDGRRD